MDNFTSKVQQAAITYADRLARLAFTYTKSVPDAEDIVQDVFLAYLKTKPELESDEHEKAWLIRVTINKAKDFLKAASRKDLPEDAIPGDDLEEANRANLSYMPEEQQEVLDAVLRLEEKYRLPIHLHYYGGYTIQEIAAILEEKPATIGTRLSRARALLKEALQEQ